MGKNVQLLRGIIPERCLHKQRMNSNEIEIQAIFFELFIWNFGELKNSPNKIIIINDDDEHGALIDIESVVESNFVIHRYKNINTNNNKHSY